jgi:hypothetical protein
MGGKIYIIDAGIGADISINTTGIITASSFVGNLTGTATGLSGNPSISVGTIGATSLNASGIVTASSFVGNLTGTASTASFATTSFGLSGNPSISVTGINASGISTFTNGPILIGSGTSTGTASQRLQVTGSAYVSGNLGIGTTNPMYKMDVVGDINTTTDVKINGISVLTSSINDAVALAIALG